MKSRYAYLMEPHRFEIREEELTCGDYQILIKITACGLCNWELLHWNGLFGSYPQRVGHEGCGIVVETGKNVTKFKVGDKVTGMMGGFCDYIVVNPDWVHKLADDINPLYGFCEPLKCVTTVVRAAEPEVGDFGAVLGCGPMGLWAIQALGSRYLADLIAIDISDSNLELARKAGATRTINPAKENALEKMKELTGGHLADFVIEGTGNANMIGEAMRLVRYGGRGRVVVMSSYKKPAESMDFGPAVDKSLQLVVAHPDYSRNQNDDLRRAIHMINSGVYDIESLVSHVFTLDNINEAFDALEKKPAGYLKGIVAPHGKMV